MTDPLLEKAFAGVGHLSEWLIPVEDYAGAQDDALFSDLVLRLRQLSTQVGNHLAREIRNGRPVNDPALAAIPPETAARAS